MTLTFADYTLLVGYISVATFASYCAHVVGQAVRGYLDSYYNN